MKGFAEAQARYDAAEPDEEDETETCPECRGSGSITDGIDQYECSRCHGTGEGEP